MFKRTLQGLIIASTLLGHASFAQTDDEPDTRWYVGVSSGLVWEDSKRQVDGGEHLIYGLSFGRMVTENIGIDVQIDRYTMDFDIPTPTGIAQTRQLGYGVVGRYYFRPGQATRPYVLLGTGIQEHDNGFDQGRDIYASAGVGVSHRYSDRVSTRLEAAWRHDNDRATFDQGSGFDDLMVQAALVYNFGAKPKPEPAPQRRPVVQPEPAPAPEPEPLFEFNAMVLFEFDSHALKPEGTAELAEAADVLQRHNELVLIEVGGHTCDIGSEAYNDKLSLQRAQAVFEYLVDQGVAAERLEVRAYGESNPRVPNTSIANRQQNRRVALSVLSRAEQ